MMSLTALLGSIELGMIYSLLALGIFISFRTLNMPDLTVDGSIVTGMALSAVVITATDNPFLGLAASVTGGCIAGLLTGILSTKLKIQAIVAGILVMLGSYSINLRIMGKRPNVPLTMNNTVYKMADQIMNPKYSGIVVGAVILVIVTAILYAFLNTRLGLVFRATGDNEDMVRASAGSVENMKILGLGLSNALVGLAGGLLAQNQLFSDINAGAGMMVIGFASLIIGEVIFGSRGLLRNLIATILGAIIYRIIMAEALYLGMESTDMKLVSATIVAVALSLGALGDHGIKFKLKARSK